MSSVPSLSQAPGPVAIASFKAFGDFVIAYSVASSIREHGHRVRILAGSHLEGLASVLSGGVTITRVQVRDDQLPALFDVRLCGVAAAFRSGLELQKTLAHLDRRPSEMLVVDRACWRSRWIGRSWPIAHAVWGVANVYADYAEALSATGFLVSLDTAPHPIRGQRVGIFPGSRIARKVIPTNVLRVAMLAIERAGFSPCIVRIDGDPMIDGLPFVTIPRTFGSLLDSLNTLDVVVSADSLSAHLGEYAGRRVFVVSRSPNPYWLPHRCFHNGHSSLFTAPDLEVALHRFLDGAS